jgi:hypothetical protein
MSNADGDRAFVGLGEIPVTQVADDARLSSGKDLFGNLAAGFESSPPTATLFPAAVRASSRARPVRLASMMNPRFGASDLDCRVHHEEQHFVETRASCRARAAHRAGRPLAEAADNRRGTGLQMGIGGFVDQEAELGTCRSADANPIAVAQRTLGDLRAVDQRAGGASRRPESRSGRLRKGSAPCSRETSLPASGRSLTERRPIENAGLSIRTVRLPSAVRNLEPWCGHHVLHAECWCESSSRPQPLLGVLVHYLGVGRNVCVRVARRARASFALFSQVSPAAPPRVVRVGREARPSSSSASAASV